MPSGAKPASEGASLAVCERIERWKGPIKSPGLGSGKTFSLPAVSTHPILRSPARPLLENKGDVVRRKHGARARERTGFVNPAIDLSVGSSRPRISVHGAHGRRAGTLLRECRGWLTDAASSLMLRAWLPPSGQTADLQADNRAYLEEPTQDRRRAPDGASVEGTEEAVLEERHLAGKLGAADTEARAI